MFYGNIEGSRSSDAARAASAAVFDGVSEVMAALAAMERAGTTDAGSEALATAAQSLTEARQGFAALADSDFAASPVNLSPLDEASQGFLVAEAERLSASGVQTARDVFELSEASIARVVAAVDAFNQNRDLGTYSTLRFEIANSLFLGQLGSLVLQTVP